MNTGRRLTPTAERRTRSILAALLLAALLLSSVAASAHPRAAAEVQVLIAFSHTPGPAEQALVRGAGGEIKYTYHLVPAIAATVPEAALDGLRRNPRVLAVEPDGQATLLDAELDNAWGVQRIGAGTVHSQGNRGLGIKVGILDSGIDLTHSDLTYDPACSHNYIVGESLHDENSHGTHVAGILAALDNDSGVVGVAPEATLCIYKIFDSGGNANYSDILAALQQAVVDGVQITSNSWGDEVDPGTTVKAAFDNAYAAGVLHVAGAGNSDFLGLIGNTCIYPALWDSVMAIGATTQSDGLDWISSTCPELELAAPGTNVYSTIPNNSYGSKSGTSMAAPHVAGTAALVWAANPGWSLAQVRSRLQATAEDLGNPGRDTWFGYGLVDADEAAAPSGDNAPPVAGDQAVTTDEDTPLAITLTASDPDGDALTYQVMSQPTHGDLTGTAPDLTYTPDASYAGPDSFTFVANDGQIDSNEATVSITINPANDPPVASDQAVTTDEDTPLAITLIASDPDGDELTYTIMSQPAHGVLSGDAPDLTYTPDPDSYGSDSFSFVANDGQIDSNEATVSITVNPANDPPVASDQAVTTDEDTPLAITLTASDPDGDPLTYQVMSQPAHGDLTGTAPDLTYRPDADYHGSDSFSFVANDGLVDSNEATVSITVDPANSPPVATDQAVTTDEDTPLAITLTASDPDGDELTYTIMSQPAHGVLSGDAPDLTYTPHAGYAGSDGFTFVANDGQIDSNVATVNITINPANSPPVAADQAVTTDEDTPVAITLTASDPDGDELTYSVVTGPAHGVLTGTAPELIYTPDPDTYGSDSFSFVANDGQIDSNEATVSITVNPVNDPPLASFSYACTELACSFDGLASSDPDGSVVSYGWDFGDGSTATGATAGHTYGAAGTYKVMLTVTDDGDATDIDIQTLTVSAAAPGLHIADLDGNLADGNKNFWWASVTLTVHDQDHNPVAGATISGTWSGGASGSGSCLTGAGGACSILSPKIATAQPSITFAVDGVTHPSLPYEPAANHDPDGDSDGTSVLVSQAGNLPPVAAFTYSCIDLACEFDGSGSTDPDGSVVSYAWDLGDGTSATGPSPSHTYAAAGTYPVILTVTDNEGATGDDSQAVSAGGSPAATMFVQDISLSGKAAGPNRTATAVVTIRDTNGNPVPGATVYATWSGDDSGSVSGVTAADGTVSFTSGRVRHADATFTFTVDSVVHQGYTYDSSQNSATSVTLVVP